MIPLLLLMPMVVQLGVRGVHLLHPTIAVAAGSAEPIGFYVNLGILAVTVIAFVLSVVQPRERHIVEGAMS
jgi:hypothetical protein